LNIKTRVIAALWFWSLVNYFDRVAIGVAGPSIMKSLAIPPSSFGIVLSSFGIGYLLAQLPGGIIADRWGGRIVMIIGPLFWALFTGLTGFAAALAGLVAVRFFFGVSEGMSVTSLHRVIGDRFEPGERARAIAICLTALALAPAVAGPFVGKLIIAFGWQRMFLYMAIPALMAATVNYWLIPVASARPTGVPQPAAEHTSIKAILLQRSFWLMAMFYLGYNIAFWGYIGWMPSYLSISRHITLASLGPMAGIPYLFAFVGLLLGGSLGTGILRKHRGQLIAASVLVSSFSLFVAYKSQSLPLCLAGLSATAFFLYGCQGAIGAVLLDLAPVRHRATYVGCVGSIGQIGGLAAPAVVGFLVSATGTFAGGFGFIIVALCAASGCMFALVRPLSRKLPQGPTATLPLAT